MNILPLSYAYKKLFLTIQYGNRKTHLSSWKKALWDRGTRLVGLCRSQD
ncbi:hypothetical protein [Methylacidiphilum caldifontis]|nr:hypothetical protein [Methylacidiphilum caldifontis]